MQVISSKENEMIKHIKKLKDKKYRDQYGEYIIEGFKMIEEAIEEKADIKSIFICDECIKTEEVPKQLLYEIAKYPCYSVPEKLFKQLTQVASPQGILAIMEKKTIESQIDYKQDIIIALDDIQDPGNLGTILRTLDSVGITQVLVSDKTADCFNPKVVRSTMGAVFRVNVIVCKDLVKVLQEAKKQKFKIVITSPKAKQTIYDMEYKKKLLVIGNEANGVSKEIEKIADEKVTIPMLGKAESLNASVATGVILYEYVRKKLNE